LTIAQAALESGWGKYHIQYNLFGIKWTEGCGYDKVPRQTKEYVNGQYVTVTAYFRGYQNFSESILDHAKVLNLPRYAKVRQAKDYKEAAQALQSCGYATDPKYAEKLISIVETYRLYEIDMEVQNMKDYEGHWAEKDIEKVKAAGIMKGYPDGSFKPDQPVTRAELATVLAKIIEK
jgi:flagellum-specific peptidoglycan hydrolase FlgJ